ncbi:hypothetical protein DICPUDRAFT_58838 [Dictyostelium purpureum]|uniref:CBM20 domain-containing protein n=1 Tax=Dictyostelium purpureum TaxID=5786 RepID=F1A367_DICPU|nr:uncharacterized protein DICPUDRAFT_58838 [Dictyostelium purpureum]EGC29362.1 hypothetical protein DICPUDRAFT_58838 [Dictyostelium purpureum]|eukprot:XP_003294106.1 hypothetical protein DICPUDRAFT_58838 [Dictyostelium purpureum]
MFRCSSSSLLCGNNVTFTMVYNTQPGENVYIVGSHPQLGEWDPLKAKRMTWNIGNIWDVNIGFATESCFVQYKYFVFNEHNKQYRWENIENRQAIINSDDYFEDKWEVKRAFVVEQAKDTDSTPNSLNSNSSSTSFLMDTRIPTMLE